MSSQKLKDNYEKAAQIFDKYVECNGTDTEPKTKKWIEKYMKDNDVEPDTFFQPSDLCYNRTTKPLGGFQDDFEKSVHLFEYLGWNKYRVIGSKYAYTGDIKRRKRGSSIDDVVGRWENGKVICFDDNRVMS